MLADGGSNPPGSTKSKKKTPDQKWSGVFFWASETGALNLQSRGSQNRLERFWTAVGLPRSGRAQEARDPIPCLYLPRLIPLTHHQQIKNHFCKRSGFFRIGK